VVGYGGKNGLRIVLEFRVAESEDGVAERGELLVAPRIPRLALVMYGAIELDDEPGLVAVEIDDVVSDLMLAAKLGAGELAVADQFPERLLDRSLFPSQFAGTFHQPGERVAAPVVSFPSAIRTPVRLRTQPSPPSPSGRGPG